MDKKKKREQKYQPLGFFAGSYLVPMSHCTVAVYVCVCLCVAAFGVGETSDWLDAVSQLPLSVEVEKVIAPRPKRPALYRSTGT